MRVSINVESEEEESKLRSVLEPLEIGFGDGGSPPRDGPRRLPPSLSPPRSPPRSPTSTNSSSNTTQQKQRRKREPDPAWWVILRFVLLSLTALVLTVTCPGDTRLWKKGASASTTTAIDWDVATKLLVASVVTYLAFFAVQGSDPGYLTAEIVADLNLQDEVALLDEDADDSDEEHPLQADGFTSIINGGMTRRTAASSPGRRGTAPADPLEPPSPPTPSSSSSSSPKRNGSAHSTPTRRHVLDVANGTTVEDGDIINNTDEAPYYRSCQRKRCQICQFCPPLRAHHCKTCNRCVVTFDHHCDFVGTCIGERNHCRFWCFLAAQTVAFVTCCRIVGSSRVGLSTLLTSSSAHTSMEAFRATVAKVYLYPLTTCSVIMLAMHTLFCLTNSTTFECAKGSQLEYMKGADQSMMDLPFSRSSVYGNLQLFCCQRDASSEMFLSAFRFWTRRTNNSDDHNSGNSKWRPIVWRPPGKIIRDSEDWWEHPLQNKYWSCC